MTDFDPLDRLIKEAFARMTDGADPRRVTASVREKTAMRTERNTGGTMNHHKKLTVLLTATLALILLTTAAAAAVMAVQAIQARMHPKIDPPEERDGEIVQSYSMEIEEHSGSLILSDEVMAVLDALPPQGKDTELVTDAIAEGSAIPASSCSPSSMTSSTTSSGASASAGTAGERRGNSRTRTAGNRKKRLNCII